MSRLEELKEFVNNQAALMIVMGDFNDENKRFLENIKFAVEKAEKTQMYEDTLKFCQFQLKNGGKDKCARITIAVDKALENND